MTRTRVGLVVAMAVLGVVATATAGPVGLLALMAGFSVVLNLRD